MINQLLNTPLWIYVNSVELMDLNDHLVVIPDYFQMPWIAILIIGLILHTGALSSLLLQRFSLLSLTQLLITTNIAFDLYYSLRFFGGGHSYVPDYLWLTPLLTIPLAALCAWNVYQWRKNPPCCKVSHEDVVSSHKPPVFISWYWGLAALCLIGQIFAPPVISFVATGILALLSILVFRFADIYQTHTISLQSIKNSYELLTDGLMFFDNEGHPLTINQAMRIVFTSFDMAPNSTIEHIWIRLIVLSEQQNSHIQSDNNIAVHTPDNQWWYFSKHTIDTTPNVIELRVSNCTRYIELLDNIEERQNDLQHSISIVKDYLAKLEDFEKEKLLLQTRAQLHDVLSQRISVIRRSLEDGVHDGERLHEIIHLLEHIEDEILSFDTDNLNQALLSLINSFKHNNLRITIDGELPEDPDVMKTLISMIREAATNAIVHGNATELNVTHQEFDSHIRFIISNNGTTQRLVREGNGMRGIRDRLQEINGSLTIQTLPIFTLIANVPLTEHDHTEETSDTQISLHGA